jgi:TonB family protein
MITWQRTAGTVALAIFAAAAGVRAQEPGTLRTQPDDSSQTARPETQEPGSKTPAEKPQRIRIGGSVEAAALTHQVVPINPQLAKQAHISGTVVLHCIIARDGSVEQVEYVSGPPLLLKSAMDAVRQWVYRPTLINGEAVEVDTTVTVVFTLGDDAKNSTTGQSASAAAPAAAPSAIPATTAPATHSHETKAADISEEPYIYEQVRGAMRYENDGTGTRDIKARIKVQSGMGIEKVGQLIFEYNSANEQLDIVRVQVTKPDGRTVVSGPDAVQDLSAPVALQAPMYSDARQKHVTVAGLSVGDTLEYDVITTTVKPLTPGQFWQTWKFVNDAPCLDEQVELNVPRNRLLKMKSPPDVSPVAHAEGDRQIYVWKTSTAHAADTPLPGFAKPKGFDPTALLRGAQPLPYRSVAFSTFENWTQVGLWYSQLEHERRAPTAEVKAQADEIAKDATTEIAKAQALYQWVTRNIRYVSLSFGVGRYQPHYAEEVLKNRYGDCKDKATLLDALLDAEGIHSATALINSKFDVDPDVPAPSQFDHAISYVSLGDKGIWLDSTAQVAPFEYLLPKLRGKDALIVFSEPGAELRRTPVDLQFSKYYRLDVDGSVTKRNVNVQIAFESRGDLEVLARAAALSLPASKLAEVMTLGAKQSSPDSTASFSDLKAGDPFDTTKPFRVELRVKADLPENSTTSTSSSSKISKSDANDALKLLLPEPPSPPGPISVYGPKELVLKVKLDAPDAKELPKFQPAHVKTDFAQFDATGSAEGHVMAMDLDLNIRVSEISASQVPQYTHFRDDVLEKLNNFIKSVKSSKPAPGPATSAVSPSSADPSSPSDEEEGRQLYASGLKAFKAGNYHAAVELLESSTLHDPHNSSAFNDLGRAYMSLNELPQAVAALRKATEVNPDDPYAFNNLGLALMRQQNFDEATTAFKKQLEVNPDDRFVHPNLGRLYLQTKEYERAVAEFEIAAKASPDNAAINESLGNAYAKANQPEKAMKALDRALDLSPVPSTQNSVAYEMAEMNLHLDRAESLVKTAIATVSAQSNTADLSKLSVADTRRMCELAAYWDTLGWIKFQESDMPQAEKFIAAAWGVCEFPEIGDHLGQIYEKEGRKADAIVQYEITLGKLFPMPETRPRLTALLPPGTNVDARIKEEKAKREATEGIKFPNPGRVADNGELWLLLKPGPTVEAVQFIHGGDAMKKTATDIRAVHFPDAFPDSTAVTLIRRAWVTCSTYTHDCHTGLIPSDSVGSLQ